VFWNLLFNDSQQKVNHSCGLGWEIVGLGGWVGMEKVSCSSYQI
jgi:hypothetical protein